MLTLNNGATILSNNKIDRLNILAGAPEIFHNTLGAILGSGDSTPKISNNNIVSIGLTGSASYASKSPTITDNTIQGGVYLTATSALITNNIIEGYIYGKSLNISKDETASYGLTPSSDKAPVFSFTGSKGSAVISNNTVRGHLYTYSYASGYLFGYIYSNGTVVTPGLAISGNNENIYLFSNTISNCSTGIDFAASGIAIIENNHFDGLKISSHANITIQNNWINNGITDNGASNLIIRNNTVDSGGIRLIGSAEISFNNIQNYNVTSISLTNTPRNVNATYNWWGTTDTKAINQSITDSKNDFNLGTVNFIPFLTKPNEQAMPNPKVPFPSALPLPSSNPTPTPNPSAPFTPTQTTNPSTTPAQPPQTATSTPSAQTAISTQISISPTVSSTTMGSIINLTGRLSDSNGTPIANEVVSLYSTAQSNISEAKSSPQPKGIPIGSQKTNANGEYNIQWSIFEADTFVFTAYWSGNSTHTAARNSTALSILSYGKEDTFLVESDTVVSQLEFNGNNSELRFTATPVDTDGYVRTIVNKNLVPKPENIRIYLDGKQLDFTLTSHESCWLLGFDCPANSHEIAVYLGLGSVFSEPPIWSYGLAIAVAVALIVTSIISLTVWRIRKRKQVGT